VATALAGAAFALTPAIASGAAIDVRGTYQAGTCLKGTLAQCEAKPEFPQILILESEDFASGALTGKGENSKGETVYSVTGSIAGCTVKVHTVQSGYTSDSTLVLSADGKKLQGTFSDSFGRSGEPSFGTRTSGPGCSGEAAEKAKEEEEEAKSGKRRTGTSVTCNYEFATSQNTCVASVGDGGAGTPVTPTGTVTFTTTSGGFANGAACSLIATPLSPQVASCTLVYQTGYSGLPSITATYGGDARHAHSAGHTQFLGAGIEESSTSAPEGEPGQYPNEIQLEAQAPVNGTTVEGSVQPHLPVPIPVALHMPVPGPGLDPAAALELGLVDAYAGNVDVEWSQKFGEVAEMGAALDKLNARAEELLRSPNPADQLKGQKAIQEAAKANEAIARMLKLQGEYAKDAIEGTSSAGRADKVVEQLDAHTLELLKSANAADQAKGQKAAGEAQKTLDALTKALKAQNELAKKAIGNTSAVSHRVKLGHVTIGRAKALARTVTRNAPAGRIKLHLRLNRAAINKLAGRRSTATLYVHVVMVLPAKNHHAGVPKEFVERFTIKRAPAKPGKTKH